jgi:hypothetical protein
MSKWIAVAALVIWSFVARADLGNQFITAKLDYGATVSIPRSWTVVKANTLQAIETAADAAIDLSGYSAKAGSSSTLILAQFPDPDLYASVTITSADIKVSSPSLATNLTASDLKEMESGQRQGIKASQEQMGVRIRNWTPIKKVLLGSNTVLLTTYDRTSNSGDRTVYLYTFFRTGRVYYMVLSTNKAVESLNRVILNRIAASFAAP